MATYPFRDVRDVGNYPLSGVVMDATTRRSVETTISFANPSSSGNTQVVAAQGAGVKIRVLSLVIVSTIAQTVKFQSATTDISAGFPVAANGGIVLPPNDHGWVQTADNEALNINLSAATATGVQVVWIPVT